MNVKLNLQHCVHVEVNQHVASVRGSGHSTALALAILSKAIARPDEKVNIIDHFEGDHADEALADHVKSIRTALGLSNVSIYEHQPAPGYRGNRRRFYVVATPIGTTVPQFVRRDA